MRSAFGFFLRLLVAFVAAKFFLRAVDWEGRLALIGITALLTVNFYWFDFLEYRDRLFLRRRLTLPNPMAGKAEEVPGRLPPADDAE